MKLFNPNISLVLWSIFAILFYGLIVVTIIKFLIVLFKVDRTIDEVREYIRRRR